MNPWVDTFLPSLLISPLVDHSNLAWSFATHQADGTWEFQFSAAFTDLTGFAAHHLPPDPFGLTFADRTTPADRERVARLRQAAGVGTAEVWVARANGTAFCDRIVVASVKEQGRPGWLVLHQDITTAHHRDEDAEKATDSPRRTKLLIELFDDLARATEPGEIYSQLLAALVPAIGIWTGVFRISARQPDRIELLASTRDITGQDWESKARTSLRGQRAAPTQEGTLIAVPVPAPDSTRWAVALAARPGQSFTGADVEMMTLIGARLGILAQEWQIQAREAARIETIESQVVAPPSSFSGIDIAAEAGPPNPTDAISAWCDAYPLPEGSAGFVVSQNFRVGTAVMGWNAAMRSLVRTLLWRRPDPAQALVDTAAFAYAYYTDPVPSAGQLAVLRPHGENFALEMASVAYLPFAVRIPGTRTRVIPGEPRDTMGDSDIPLLFASEVLPPGSVIFFLTQSLFDGDPALIASSFDRLTALWDRLPDDAPASAYARVTAEYADKLLWKRQRCFLIARIVPVAAED